MKKTILAAAGLVLIAGYASGSDMSDALGKNPASGIIGSLSVAGLLWGLLFSSVGVFAFLYGKKKSKAAFMAIGILLIAYPYVVQQTTLIIIIGAALCGAMYFFRRG